MVLIYRTHFKIHSTFETSAVFIVRTHLELNCHHQWYNLIDFLRAKWDSYDDNSLTYPTISVAAQFARQTMSFKEQRVFPMNIRKHELILLLVFPRFVAPTIRLMLAPVICLLLSADWREPKRGTTCSWIILEPANVRSHHYNQPPFLRGFLVNLCISL